MKEHRPHAAFVVLVVALIALAYGAPSYGAYSIAVSTCSYADYESTGFSGNSLDVSLWNSYGYQAYGVHDMTSGTSYLTMWCQVSVPDGTQFNRIGIVGYDNGQRSVCAWLQKIPAATTGTTWSSSGVCTSNIAGSVQFPFTSFTMSPVDNSTGAYYVPVWFIPGTAQGAGAWAFVVQLWYSASAYDDPADAYQCENVYPDPQAIFQGTSDH
jgi:hypothetical protein